MKTLSNPRTPTALRVLADNPGKRPLPKDEPTFAPASLEAPLWLSGEALAQWYVLSAGLDANGMLNTANRELLATYCDLLGTYIQKRKDGAEPDLKIIQQLRMIAREFGFTPSSQAGISAPAKLKEGNGKARFFAS